MIDYWYIYAFADTHLLKYVIMNRHLLFDRFSQQALQTLHSYRAVMFSPTMFL